MTFQTPELFIYKGHAFDSSDEPLYPLLEQRGIERLDFGLGGCSACWRGYVGTWHISKGRLYLIDLTDVTASQEIDLSVVFPGCENRVLAYWFTGVIQLPFGDHIEDDEALMQMTIDPTRYERYYELAFESGVLISEREVSGEGAAADG